MAALVAACLESLGATAAAPGGTPVRAPASHGPGGPILVLTDPADGFGTYYGEILRAEGLAEFSVRPLARGTATATLDRYQVIVLAARSPTVAQATRLSRWVHGGGDLVAMRPTRVLARLLGLRARRGVLHDRYLAVDTASTAGAGVTATTMQFHGTADRWQLAGAHAVARLYWDARHASPAPAVTLRSVGRAGGQAAAFTYDLARSVVGTRQGNPAWAGRERDGSPPVRSDDLFVGDGSPGWVDPSRVAVPQADEQQRLLANLITRMSSDRAPLPRFWYLPHGQRAAVVLTGDDHGNGGTIGAFARLRAASRPGCSVADWQCVRATSYVYPSTPISAAQARALTAEGFELALHVSTGCHDYTTQSLENAFGTQLAAFAAAWPTVPAPRTSRTHCIAWSTWSGSAPEERRHGIRLDTNYYYWPAAWVRNRPGLFTGSAMPMRFADRDGRTIDVYQVATQLTDESGIDVGAHIRALLDRALGSDGFYGVFTANMHTDRPHHPGTDAIVAAARARGVPVISARQLLTWLDARNNSSFAHVRFARGALRFAIRRAAGARGLEAMVPLRGGRGTLATLRRDGRRVAFVRRQVKGTVYAVFAGAAGRYVARYA